MSKSTPSLLALLGLVAFAGYQNRGKLTEMLVDGSTDRQPGAGAPQDQSLVDRVGGMFGSGIGGVLLLIELLDRFRLVDRGQPRKLISIAKTPHRQGSSEIVGETPAQLSAKTGLTRSELLSRLRPGCFRGRKPDPRRRFHSIQLETGLRPISKGGPVNWKRQRR